MLQLARNFNLSLRHLIKYQNTVKYCQKNTQEISEATLMEKLKQRFPKAVSINVEDTSGGCGAMFNVSIETEEFKGLSIMKQHRLVYDLLGEQLKAIHGLHLQTKAPK